MMFTDKVAVITGGASGIGRAVADRFVAEGAHVCVIDQAENAYFTGDLAEEPVLEAFAEKVLADYGYVDYLINNAPPVMKGIFNSDYQTFSRALAVGIAAPFRLAQLFLPHFDAGAAIVNISSTRARMSQPNTESYSAAKGGLDALTHAMAISLSGKVRVNTVSPGWINTSGDDFPDADAKQHPVHRIGHPSDIAEMVLYLCSEKAAFINGENICIDGGMTRQMIYSGDFGWTFTPNKK